MAKFASIIRLPDFVFPRLQHHPPALEYVFAGKAGRQLYFPFELSVPILVEQHAYGTQSHGHISLNMAQGARIWADEYFFKTRGGRLDAAYKGEEVIKR